MAEPAPNDRLRTLARSRSLWDTDLTAPADLPPLLARAGGETISYNAVGPAGEPQGSVTRTRTRAMLS